MSVLFDGTVDDLVHKLPEIQKVVGDRRIQVMLEGEPSLMTNKALYESRPRLKFYLPEVPADIKMVDKTAVETYDDATDKWKDRTAVIFYGRKMSYRELRDHVDRFATAM